MTLERGSTEGADALIEEPRLGYAMYDTETVAPQPPDHAFDGIDPRSLPPAYRRVPNVGVLASVARHPFLVAIPIIVLVAVAAFLGARRTPVYTADASVQVGRLDVSSPGALSAFSTATESLASAYSRALQADSVISAVAAKAHLPAGAVRANLSASPIPDSPLFQVEATAPDERTAVALANTASTELLSYLRRVNVADPDGARLFSEYRQVQRAMNQQQTRVGRARSAYDSDPSTSNLSRLHKAEVRLKSLQLRSNASGQAYLTSQQGRAISADANILTAATSASSDRVQRLELYVFLGFLVGIVVGLALATLVANRTVRRAALR